MKAAIIPMTMLAVLMSTAGPALTHCEVPCGIYDDALRVRMIEEHITTIEKAMKQIVELSGQSPRNDNQIARWILNKESHADELQHIVSQYFLTQRIKSDSAKYVEHLKQLHEMLVLAMTCKQTTDTANTDKLREVTKAFSASYLGPDAAHQH